MAALNQTTTNKAKLGLRIKSRADIETLRRDLREIFSELDERLQQMEALLENHEARITTLE